MSYRRLMALVSASRSLCSLDTYFSPDSAVLIEPMIDNFEAVPIID